MRVPEPLFPLINRVMQVLLNSPLHGVMSGSIMLIYFTGTKTGRHLCTPVRYLRGGDGVVVCLTGREVLWWPNFRRPTAVALQLAGQRVNAMAQALPDDTAQTEVLLRRMLAYFPTDAAYHGIAVKRGSAPSPQQLQQAAANAVLVTFSLSR